MGIPVSLLFSNFTQMTILPVVSTATILTLKVSANFFFDLFMNPTHHAVVVMVFSGVVIAAVVGIIFLIKMLFDKYYPLQKPKL